MAEVMYSLRLLVPARMLTPLLELLEKDGVVAEVSVHQPSARHRPRRRPDGPSQADLAFKAIQSANGELDVDGLERVLRSAGHRRGAAASVIQNLIRECSVRRDERGHLWAMVPSRPVRGG